LKARTGVNDGQYYDDELLVRKPKDIQLEGDLKSFIQHCIVLDKKSLLKNKPALSLGIKHLNQMSESPKMRNEVI